MGTRKRWSRLITVDGVRFRYHVAEEHFDGLGLHVCIQQVEPPGQRLLSGFASHCSGLTLDRGIALARSFHTRSPLG